MLLFVVTLNFLSELTTGFDAGLVAKGVLKMRSWGLESLWLNWVSGALLVCIKEISLWLGLGTILGSSDGLSESIIIEVTFWPVGF